jgi:hypothetical protein
MFNFVTRLPSSCIANSVLLPSGFISLTSMKKVQNNRIEGNDARKILQIFKMG